MGIYGTNKAETKYAGFYIILPFQIGNNSGIEFPIEIRNKLFVSSNSKIDK